MELLVVDGGAIREEELIALSISGFRPSLAFTSFFFPSSCCGFFFFLSASEREGKTQPSVIGDPADRQRVAETTARMIPKGKNAVEKNIGTIEGQHLLH